MGIFKNWYQEYKELKLENTYYTRECFKKEDRIRELKKQNRQLQEQLNQALKDYDELIQKPKKRGRPRKEVKND